MTALRTAPKQVLPGRVPDPAAAALAELAEALGEKQAPGEWSRRAACRDARDDLHHPTGREDSPAYRRQADAAKTTCRSCLVVTECLAHALDQGEDEGIWGGTTPAERRLITNRTYRHQPLDGSQPAVRELSRRGEHVMGTARSTHSERGAIATGPQAIAASPALALAPHCGGCRR